jgi:nucleotide-binding universal stress UspA family protein
MTTTAVRAKARVANVLFATDFSPAASAALPFATEIAKRFEAKLYALYVRPPVLNPMTPPATWPVLEEAARNEEIDQKERLRNFFPGIPIEPIVMEGELQPVLDAAVAENRIDLIIVGTHGRSGLGKLLRGSAAEEIFRHATCPVLVVGPQSHLDPARRPQFSEILYATDFRPEAHDAASYGVSLAQEYQAHLTLLHVITESEAGDLVHAQQVEASAARLLRELVPCDAELWCRPDVVVEHGDAAEKILYVARERNVDLIVLGARRPTGVPGAATHLPIATAHKVVSHASCPVLTIHS